MNSPFAYQKFVVLCELFVVIFLLLLMMPASVTASIKSPVKVDLEISEAPALNQPFQMTCTVKSMIAAPNTSAEILLPDGAELLSGKLTWAGDLEKDRAITFTALAVFRKTGNHTIEARAKYPIDETNFWGDGKEIFLHVDIDRGQFGYLLPPDSEVEKVVALDNVQFSKALPTVNPVLDPLNEKPFIPEELRQKYDDPPQLQSAAGRVTVSGRFYYFDARGQLTPGKYVTVYLFDQDDLSDDDYLGVTITDKNGYWQIRDISNYDGFQGTLDIYTVFTTSTDKRRVENYDDQAYEWKSNVTKDVPDGNVDLGRFEVRKGNQHEGALWIFQVLRDGWAYVSRYNDPGKCTVEWEYLRDVGAEYVLGEDIHLRSSDRSFPDVILHEVAHNYMWNIYGEWFPNTHCPSPHYLGQASHVNCAWTEGWASFFPLAVYDDGTANAAIFNLGYSQVNMESPDAAWDRGDEVEGRVTAALWDIYDKFDDGADQHGYGFDEIWDVIYNQNDNRFSEFWSAWKTRGHAKHHAVASIYQNTIDYNTKPLWVSLPDQTLEENSSALKVIDLWNYVWDNESTDLQLSFSIVGNTNPNCGVRIAADRYIDIIPGKNWYGHSDVTIQVSDLAETATDEFRINVYRTTINAPTNLAAVANGASVKLTWRDNSDSEEGFKIERMNGANGSWSEIATISWGREWYEDKSAAANEFFTYRIRAYSGSNFSDYSNASTAWTLGKPASLIATAASPERIDLHWQDTATQEDGFKIEMRENPHGSWNVLAVVNADVESYQSTGLLPGIIYSYRVRAYRVSAANVTHYSAYSNEAAAAPTTTIPISDGFDYPIGATGFATQAKDNVDEWYNAQDFRGRGYDPKRDHLGEDWNNPEREGGDCGLPVYAASKGKIVYAANTGGSWGNVVIIRHLLPDGTEVETLYGHLTVIERNDGLVGRRELIGTIGDGNGNFDCHLHFELRHSNCTSWGLPGPGYLNNSVGWTDPSDFIDSHRTLGAQIFSDIPSNSWKRKYAELVYIKGLMSECDIGPRRFCPDAPVTRAKLAVYWLKGHFGPGYTPPPATKHYFADVPPNHPQADWIEQFFEEGFTAGCVTDLPLMYCPDQNLSRAEMAVFILKAIHDTGYRPPAPSGNMFDDVPANEWFAKWVEQLAAEGITAGCSSDPPLFCPFNPLTRAEVAVFLLRAFNYYPRTQNVASSPEITATWQADLNVRDAGGETTTLIFGQAPSATAALDVAFGEAELPPVPPTGILDARFELPVTPQMASIKDYRSDWDEKTLWKVNFQPGAGGYPMTLSWNQAELPRGFFTLKDAITGNFITLNMKTRNSLTVSNSAINTLIIEKRTTLDRRFAAGVGWNLVSLPVNSADMSKVALFPTASSLAYGFESGYVSADTLQPGRGYWLKFNASLDQQITGVPAEIKEVPVKAGWNIIGPFESDAQVANLTTQPADLIQSNFFGFENGYVMVSTLRVGKGYWVKVSQDGKLYFPEEESPGRSDFVSLTKSSAAEEIADWPRIQFEDQAGGTGILYLAANAEVGMDYSLPPIPPAGIFDLRFSSGRFVEDLNKDNLEVHISAAVYPLKIHLVKLSALTLRLKDAGTGKAVKVTLIGGAVVEIREAADRLALNTKEQSTLPTQYELSQNHPNPFNPTTVIKFALPEARHVQITVYNALGEKVMELMDAELPVGQHQVEFNAKNQASGVYFYVMKSGDFMAVKKMLVLR